MTAVEPTQDACLQGPPLVARDKLRIESSSWAGVAPARPTRRTDPGEAPRGGEAGGAGASLLANPRPPTGPLRCD
jgi:hypothetical protein